MKNTHKIFVTKPYLPSLSLFNRYIEGIWSRAHLTNNGPLVQELESKLKKYLGVKYLFFVSNGTIAIQLALRALNLKGEIITTPFSFVASTTAILWENCQPVFVDIEPNTFCIDTKKIEKQITKKTCAILAVHVYGHPCNVLELERIAKKHNLKLIYDAAHAFGVRINNQSILNYGDVSTLSFHATKLFHTIEGGAIITNNKKLAEKISLTRSFGLVNEKPITPGINGKNSEFHAAMGLALIPDINLIIDNRRLIVQIYDEMFKNTPIKRPALSANIEYNYAYYPVLFNSEKQLLKGIKALNDNNIFPRRYFYPSLNTMKYLKHKSSNPISESISSRILCLPLYTDLPFHEVQRIAKILIKSQN